MSRVLVKASAQYLTGNWAPVTAVPISYSMRFWTESLTINQVILTVARAGGNTDDWRVLLGGSITNDPFRALAWRSGAGSFKDIQISPAVQTWYQVGGMWKSSSAHMTVVADGTLAIETALNHTPLNVDGVRIGARIDADAATLVDGRVAEVGLWNVELTADEWAALGKGYSPACIRPSGLVFYCPLIDDSDVDLISGNALTATGSPTVGEHPPVIYRRRGRVVVPSTYVPPAATGSILPHVLAITSMRRRT